MTEPFDPEDYGLKRGTKTIVRDLAIKSLDVDDSKRTVIARITSDAVDEEGEVVVPQGIDYSRFLKTGGIVFYNHEYDKPCATCISIKHTDSGIMATTKFPERPDGYEGDWLPDQVFAMFASEPPIVKSFSIGFAYVESRLPSKKDQDKYGSDDIKRVVSKSRLLEYSVAPLPMNPDATVSEVRKAMDSDRALCHTDQCSSQEPHTHVESSSVTAEDAEQHVEARPERVSVSSPHKKGNIMSIDKAKAMVDLDPSMTLGDLVAAMAAAKGEHEDDAEKKREEVEERVYHSKKEEEEKGKHDEDEKGMHEDEKDKKSLTDLASEIARKGRARVAGGMPRIEAPSHARLKNLKSAEHAYGFGRVLLGAMGHKSSADWVADRYGRKAQSESNNSLGGFLVPEELDEAIIDLRAEHGKFRANTRVLNMQRDVMMINRRVSGLTANAVAENGTFSESEKTFDQVQLVTQKFGTLTKVSSELLADSVINIGDDIAGEIAYAFANKEDECGFNGDGTESFGRITGLKNAVGSAGTKTGSGSSFGALTLADFTDTIGLTPEFVFSRTAPKWYMSTQFYHSVVLKLLNAAGGNTNQLLADGVTVPSLFGYEVVKVDVMPKTSASGVICAYFGALDLSSTMGDRRPTEVATSTDFAFNQDQTAIRGMTRFDINNHDVGDSTDAGAIVALKTA
jgi:HK97 family phage major capsid protein